MNATEIPMTLATQALFKSIVDDLPNWSFMAPTFNHADSAKRGNLTNLKRRGLITTCQDEGISWISVTDEGKAVAKATGIWPANYGD